VSVSKVAAAAWLSSAVVVVGAAGGAIYQLANPSSSPSASPSSQPTSPTLGGGNVSPGNTTGNGTTGNTTGNGTTGNGTGNGTTGNTTGNGTGNGTTGNTTGNNGHPIVVTGSMNGPLAPGVSRTLTVTIDNAKNQAINIRTVTASITSVTSGSQIGKPACDKSWFTVGSFSGAQYVAKGAKGTVTLPVTFTNLATTNQDNCKGTSVGLSFTATADQA
jgi:hypothetical protein